MTDIHIATAALLNDVPEGAVTPEMRARAKEINGAMIFAGPTQCPRCGQVFCRCAVDAVLKNEAAKRAAGIRVVPHPSMVPIILRMRMQTYDRLVGGGTRARRRYLAKARAAIRTSK